MDLICYLHPGWAPLIRRAPATRPWMDATPEAFAYRCLPLNIANAHGWEVLSPCAFEAVWDGGTGTGAVTIALEGEVAAHQRPASMFGQGVLTFHIEGLFRTPPGWDLWVGGSPNRMKDGIAPLGGVIETDWSPFTFTMNWRFTRPHHAVRFQAMEPICFLMPVQRGAVEAFDPRFEPLDADPETRDGFLAWSRARDAFHGEMRSRPPGRPSQHWQKHYYRGVDVEGKAHVEDHRAKLRLKDFDRSRTPEVPPAPADDAALQAEPAAERDVRLARREWLLETMERQRGLSAIAGGMERRAGLTGEEFLDSYYAPGRPVVLIGELAEWPALKLWTPDYLKARLGEAVVEFQGTRDGDPDDEPRKQAHTTQAPFGDFIDRILAPGAGADAYLTAYNSSRNRAALAPLREDLGTLDAILETGPDAEPGLPWIGAAGAFTPLHHDLANSLFVQAVGRRRIKLIPSAEVGRLYNHHDVFSQIGDLDDPGLDFERFPRLRGVKVYDLVLAPGEALFVPVGWWRQARALEFNVTVTYTSFRWPNDAHLSFPRG